MEVSEIGSRKSKYKHNNMNVKSGTRQSIWARKDMFRTGLFTNNIINNLCNFTVC